MARNEGRFAITEQGDLGLGLTPIDESINYSAERKSENKNNKDSDKDNDLY